MSEYNCSSASRPRQIPPENRAETYGGKGPQEMCEGSRRCGEVQGKQGARGKTAKTEVMKDIIKEETVMVGQDKELLQFIFLNRIMIKNRNRNSQITVCFGHNEH